jgi:small subunit ribosomal protein S6
MFEHLNSKVREVPNYELIYIISPNVTDETLPDVMTKVGDTVKKNGGNVTEVVQWGKKKFTYPIKNFHEGNYVLAKIDIETTAAKKIDANLKMDESILRHLLIKANA